MLAVEGLAPVLALALLLAAPVSSRAQDVTAPPTEDANAVNGASGAGHHHRRHGHGAFGQNGRSAGAGMPTTGPALSGMVWFPWLRQTAQASADGALTQDQLDAARAAFMAHFDANGDGTITADELAAEQAAWVKQLDTNGDGSISREEMEAAGPHRGSPDNDGDRGAREGMNPGAQPTDPAAAAAIQTARQELRDASASGDKTRIEAARKAFWEARRAANGPAQPAADGQQQPAPQW